jgi:hypothetical protein
LSKAGFSGMGLPMGKEPVPTREERLATKLRENLKRRKQQARELANDAKAALPKAESSG